jgi:hypothetical protein
MIYEWKLDGVTRNFGDTLYEITYPNDKLLSYAQDSFNRYHLVGSVICNTVIQESLDLGLLPVFIDCGWRGESLDPGLVKQSMFIGCRGPNTQFELARHGVSVTVTGDTAYKVPYKVTKAQPTERTIMIPHIQDPLIYDYDIDFYGVDELVSPAVTNLQSTVDLIQKISGAKFVFTGSLHAAMISHAYGVPFSLMKTYVNCMPKWIDWAMSVGIDKLNFQDRPS